MANSTLLIQFSTSPAFASGIIRRLSHSRFSHVDIVLPGEGLLGASGPGKWTTNGHVYKDPGGVQIRPFDPWPYLGPAKVAHVLAEAERVREIIAAARSQINKPFDNKALYSFIRDQIGMAPNKEVRDWRALDSWFCSELVVWACETGGLFRYVLIVLEEAVSPNDALFMLNPYMTFASIRDFLQ